MNKKLVQTGLSNAINFSVVTFIVIWLGGFLFTALEETSGSMSMGASLIIMLGIITIMFVLAVFNIILHESKKEKVTWVDRILSIGIFLIASAIILAVLGILFWYPF